MKNTSTRLFVLCGLLFTACGFGASRPAEYVVFGTTISITGKTAKEGESVLDGYLLYIEDINARGGIKVGNRNMQVKLIYYDDESRPERSVELFEKLILEDKVDLLLGPYGSTPTAAAAVISEKYQLPMVVAHGSAGRIYRDGYRYTFGIQTPARNYLRGVIALVTHLDPNIRSVAILVEDELFSREVADGATEYAQQRGLNIIYSQRYPAHTQDVSVLLNEIKILQPDVLLGAGHLQDSILVARQAHDLGLTPKAMGFSVGPSYPEFRANLKQRADFIFGSTQWTDALLYHGEDAWQTPKAYAEAFKARFSNYSSVPYQAAESTAALFVYQKAIEQVGSLDKERIRDALAQLDTTTFFGRIKFDSRGINSDKPMAVEQLQTDGKKYTVFPLDVGERAALYPLLRQP